MKRYYFVGIGGIGMSAIAKYLKVLGNEVYGYDKTCTELTTLLEKDGIPIIYEDDYTKLPKDIDLVIYTPAISKDNNILNHFISNNIPLKKRSEILEDITKGKKCIAIAGTHGKTTCSTMIAHILNESNVKCSAFLGGISKNFDSNYLINNESQYVVVEADEFDHSFLRLNPTISAITSIDADHLDIYGNIDELKKSFEQFANNTSDAIFIKRGVDLSLDEDKEIEQYYYTISGLDVDYYAINIRNYNGTSYFDLRTPNKIYYDICLNYGGVHNVENAVLSIAISLYCGVSEDEMRRAVESFNGVKRRFDVQIKRKDFIFIDDYAHHPNEIRVCVNSLRMLYPNKKITGVFQPHLFSRTRDFMDDFAKALELLDEVVLLDIYPAREKPIEGINSKQLLHKINKMDKYYCTKQGLLDLLEALYPEVLVTMGAGDISDMVKDIKTKFEDE
ncbi:MAG: UDP-N-acetylmuramate--L-alanine ligase [Bacteroidales bacterium]|jgi:UDP-N-acetylmuramate--alanine ligase|nr:UDP-N-acetylmuramate--L-alanine ligase [Bacteroidales bacterium]